VNAWRGSRSDETPPRRGTPLAIEQSDRQRGVPRRTPEADARLRAMVHAAIRAGVDFVAIDEYELFAATLHEMRIR